MTKYYHDDNSYSDDDDTIEITKRQLLAEEERYQKQKNQLRQLQLNIPFLSVSEALRTNSGMAKVTGMITSRSNIYKMKSELTLTCNKCGDSTTRSLNVPISTLNVKKENCFRCQKENCVIETDCTYVNAVTVELQDTETFNEIERLHVILFDEDTIDINLGERVVITGQIEILNETRHQRSHSILFAKSVEYESKEEIVVTPKDKEAIERFTIKLKSREKIIDQLISMFDNSVIGHDHVKKGLLLTSVSTLNVNSNDLLRNNNKNTKRRKYRIHSLVIGEPGLAKTLLLKSTKDLVPKSRYESSQNSSGKSLTAIVSKEDENHVLRLGPVPLAKDAICALNELGRMSLEDQGHLLDVMEEEEFTINKYGINAKILSPTSIIASANPMNNSRWSNKEKIDLDEIPALKPIIDRFDFVFVVRGLENENNIREFINSKSQQEDSLIPDYSSYLKKHIAYARRLNPVFSDEAKSILNEFAIKVASKARSHKNGGENIWTRSPRRRDSLYRTAKAIARLKLKDVIDVKDADEAVKFYNVILTQLENTVSIPIDPRDETFNECMTILKQYEKLGGITLDELFKKACENNLQVSDYLKGLNDNKSLRIDKNHKTRTVYGMLLNSQNVRKVGENPIVLKWSSSSSHPSSSNESERVEVSKPFSIIQPDAPDVSDIKKLNNGKKDEEELKENNFSNTKNQMSGMSGMSGRMKATKYSSKGSVYLENLNEKDKEMK